MDKKKELKEDQNVVHGTPGNTHFISLPTNEIFTESKWLAMPSKPTSPWLPLPLWSLSLSWENVKKLA